ncbi:putative secondary metabolism biosynthetic enzyme [Sporothrix stenoceras]|uniref:Kynureninase n=1 Tax=Sporothrix stenoceras TaxID=5173 RepID=A0ABR3Z929_9PEZI
MSTFSEISTALLEHPGVPVVFADNAHTLDFAEALDAQDPLKHLQHEFVRPTKHMIRKAITAEPLQRDGDVKSEQKENDIPTAQAAIKQSRGLTDLVPGTSMSPLASEMAGKYPRTTGDSNMAMYFCGNSLGLQPRAVRRYVETQLDTWASIGVKGHFQTMESELQLERPNRIRPWQEMAAVCSQQMSRLVGALPEEVATMNTLTVNLHLMMASFYKPTTERYKIIAEWKPFPSDSYALESQIVWHGLDVAETLIELQPDENYYISTESVLATIDKHDDQTALLMLPGIQYYTGQLFDIPRITAYAQSKGIVVGWDLAHAIGNVELKLHEWDVDFAVWCTYKYCNAGPGSIAGAFVNERHGKVEADPDVTSAESDYDVRTGGFQYRPRLSGWYGSDLSVRFNMAKTFQPTPGAQGFQLSNPSAIDLASLNGALSVFDKTDMKALRTKSLVLTAYSAKLLDDILRDAEKEQANIADKGLNKKDAEPPFRIITPANPSERGAQISVLMRDDDFLDRWTYAMEKADIVMDKRKPNVIRIAPVPMYNTFVEVHHVVRLLREEAHEISPPGNRIAAELGFRPEMIKEIFGDKDEEKSGMGNVVISDLDKATPADRRRAAELAMGSRFIEKIYDSSSSGDEDKGDVDKVNK